MAERLYEQYESLDLLEAGESLLYAVSKTPDANAQAKLVDQFREKLESSNMLGIDDVAVGKLLEGTEGCLGLLALCGAMFPSLIADRMKPISRSALLVVFDLVIVKGFAETFVRQPVAKLQAMRFDKHLKRGDEEEKQAAFELLRVLENRRSNDEIRSILFQKSDVIDLFTHRTRSALHRSVSSGQFDAFEEHAHHLQHIDEREERSPVLGTAASESVPDPRLRLQTATSLDGMINAAMAVGAQQAASAMLTAGFGRPQTEPLPQQTALRSGSPAQHAVRASVLMCVGS